MVDQNDSDDEIKYGLVLLWTGVGLGSYLASLGYHWLLCNTVMLIFIAIWAVQNVKAKLVVRGVLFTAAEVFFKDFDVAGKSRIPDEGVPVILACAPHANQFVDPIVVTKAISSRKDIGFLCAAKTMRKKWIGKIAKTTNAISVERPQDLATTGSGTLEIEPGSCNVKGNGTRFTDEMKCGDLLFISSGAEKGYASRITEITNDTNLVLKRPLKNSTMLLTTRLNAAEYKIHPLLDQSSVFDAVYDRLHAGHCVGIFPEGGSHDRTQLLPIKQGVSVMALGALAKYPSMKNLQIIPVGINYFNGHRFRSRVFVDIGQPIVPHPSLVAKYMKGGIDRKEAQLQLLQEVKAGLSSVTIETENYDDLQFLRAVRRLYKASTIKATGAERHAFMSAFADGYKRDKNEASVVQLYAAIKQYRTDLELLRISDHEVAHANKETLLSTTTVILTLLKSVLYLLACCCVFLPGLLIILPWRTITRRISAQKAAAALKGSSVKISGKDVLATWKLMTSIGLIPIQHMLMTFIFYYFGGESYGVGYFFFAPFVALLTIKATERGLELYSSIKPLWKALIAPESTSGLIEMRNRLKKDVRGLVSRLKWNTTLGANMGERRMRRLSSIGSEGSFDYEYQKDVE